MKNLALVAFAILAFGCAKKAAPTNTAPASTAMPACCKMENGTHSCQHGGTGPCCAGHASK